MSDLLAIRRLTIKDAPGFAQGGLRPMEFCDGINVIFGPNASGKTTTARAIQSLLWPTGKAEIVLSAEMALGGNRGQFCYQYGERQDDPALPLPSLGASANSHRYMLAQHELLAKEVTGAEFARIILQEARGGLDLDAAKQRLTYQEAGRVKRTSEYSDALVRYRVALKDGERVRYAEVEIEELTLRLAQAKVAQQTVERLRLALDFQQKSREEAQLAETIAQFPPELAALIGQELAELDALELQLRTAADNRAEAEREIADAERRLQACALTDPAAVDAAIAVNTALCTEIEQDDRNLEREQRDRQQAETEARGAYAKLGGQEIAHFADPLEATVVTALEAYARQMDSLLAKQQALDEQLRLAIVTPLPEDDRSAALQAAARCLNEWLASEEVPQLPPWLPGAGIGASLLAAIAGLLSALLNQSVFGAIALLGGILVSIFFFMMSRRLAPRRTRADVQQRFTEQHTEIPVTWTDTEVTRCLDALSAQLAELAATRKVAEKTAERRKELTLSREALIKDIQAMEPEKVRLAGLLGIDPARISAEGTGSFCYVVGQLVAWQQKRDAVVKAQAEIARLESARGEKLARANTGLAAFGYAPVASGRELQNLLELLKQRKNDAQRAEETRRTSLSSLEKIVKRADEVLVRRTAMLARLGLNSDADEARRQLHVLLPQLPSYLDTNKRWQNIAAVRADVETRGRRWPEWDELIATGEVALQQRQDEMKAQAEQVAALGNSIGECKERIRQAKEQVACEQAQVALERAVQKQRRRLDDTLHAVIGWYLTEELKKQVVDIGLPHVFQRAKQLFADFTRGRYSLRVHGNGEEFCAYDESERVERQLDQLSSATRVQLLMAVRVAFVEGGEQGVTLPLLMDEALANSDDIREEAIITATLHICRQGRQLFYFTSKPAELAKWRQLARESGVELRVIELAETPSAAVIQPLAARAAIADPAGMSHEDYALALGVSRVNFVEITAAGVHPWYLLDDDPLLKQILEMGIVTVGQFRQAYLTRLLEERLGPAAYRKAMALSELLDELERCYRIGRGKPLSQQALQESGILTTDTYRQAIPALAASFDWEAKPLLAALESGAVSGFRKTSCQKLREYCDEHDHLADEEKLSESEIELQLLGRAADPIAQGVLTPGDVQRLCARVLGAVPVA